jgi:hypothetical protein
MMGWPCPFFVCVGGGGGGQGHSPWPFWFPGLKKPIFVLGKKVEGGGKF